MSEKLPQPLTPSNCDLRDFDGFLMNVERLLASELWALSTSEEFKCAMALWCRAWKQIPCASLPDDDAVLAAFSGAGKRWSKVKKMALRGFVKCSDGRLYHSTLAEDAMRAMKAKAENSARTKKATEARSRKKLDDQRDDIRDVDRNVKRDVDRDVPHNGNVTRSQYSTVQGIEDKKDTAASSNTTSSARAGARQQPLDRLAKAIGIDLQALLRLPKFQEFPGMFAEWKAAGCDPDRDIWPTIERIAKRSKSVKSPRFFEAAILEAKDNRLASEPSENERWTVRVTGFFSDGFWSEHWGPKPGDPGCKAPPELLPPA